MSDIAALARGIVSAGVCANGQLRPEQRSWTRAPAGTPRATSRVTRAKRPWNLTPTLVRVLIRGYPASRPLQSSSTPLRGMSFAPGRTLASSGRQSRLFGDPSPSLSVLGLKAAGW